MYYLASLAIQWYIPVIIFSLVAILGVIGGFGLYFRGTHKLSTKKSTEKKEEYVALSQMAVDNSSKYLADYDENGEELIGIIFNPNSRVVYFKPNGNKVNVGDVVRVKDLQGELKAVPVVIPNCRMKIDSVKGNIRNVVDVVFRFKTQKNL